MTQTFHELVLGGVLIAPILRYAAITLALIVLLRPILNHVGFSNFFSHPSIAELCLYITIFGVLTLLS